MKLELTNHINRTRACQEVIATSGEERQLIDKVLFQPGGIDTRSATADRLSKTNVLSDFRQGYQLRIRKLDFTSPLVRGVQINEPGDFQENPLCGKWSSKTTASKQCTYLQTLMPVFASEGWVNFYVDDNMIG
ncbi:10172_t:CDS:2 [Ambispora leptoticha]|uniref:10172_t:CDS:1 n=1 Tax=Ambispora leptoticha TaxID=144679 RepID=A0A9N8WIG4_9GLOM|nr:10172_t:CDS:2 [Ambispora leptoticha]